VEIFDLQVLQFKQTHPKMNGYFAQIEELSIQKYLQVYYWCLLQIPYVSILIMYALLSLFLYLKAVHS